MKNRKWRINYYGPRNASITIDGEELKHMGEVNVSLQAGRLPLVEIFPVTQYLEIELANAVADTVSLCHRCTQRDCSIKADLDAVTDRHKIVAPVWSCKEYTE